MSREAAAEPVLHVEALAYRRAGEGAGFALFVEALRLERGEVAGIAGPSGCGKSTLVDLLALLRKPASSSRFMLAGRDAGQLWQSGDVAACTALRAAAVGVVLQTGGLLPSLSVRENVMLSQRLLGAVDEAWVDSLLDALDIAALGSRKPSQISIGQRQRVAIARALAHRPALVLADEPTASLGIDHAPAAMSLLLSLARESGTAVLVVSHDLRLLEAHQVPIRRCTPRDGAIWLEAA